MGFSVALNVGGFTQFPGLIGRSGFLQLTNKGDVSYKENIVVNVYIHQLMHLFISPREH